MALAGTIESVIIEMHVELLGDFADSHGPNRGIKWVLTLLLQPWRKMPGHSRSRNVLLAFIVEIINDFLAVTLPTKIILRIYRYLSGFEAWPIECGMFLVNRRRRGRNIILRFRWIIDHILTLFLEIDVLIFHIDGWWVAGVKSLHTVMILLNNRRRLVVLKSLLLRINFIISDLLPGIFFLNFVFLLIFFFYNAWLLSLKLADRRWTKCIFIIAIFIMGHYRALTFIRNCYFDIQIACEVQKAHRELGRYLLVDLFAVKSI